jgi:hypothetical protein
MKKPRLLYSESSGQGGVKFPDEWSSFDDVIKLDVLKDWIYDLTKEYEQIQIKNNPQILVALGHGVRHE